MEGFGFIHGELDIKILILYVLRRLPIPVEKQQLSELCSCDTGVGWFDFSDCLDGLCEAHQVEEFSGGRFAVTEQGRINGETAETSLPYSVRRKADKLIRPVAMRMKRDALIETSHDVSDSGVHVSLRLSDGKGEVASLTFAVPDEETAERFEKTFRRDAEGVYAKVLEIFGE